MKKLLAMRLLVFLLGIGALSFSLHMSRIAEAIPCQQCNQNENYNSNENENENENYNENLNCNGNENENNNESPSPQGGAAYHSECVNGQCKYVMGAGPNQCHRDAECMSQGSNENTNTNNHNTNSMSRNMNENGNVNMNRNENFNRNVNGINENRNDESGETVFTDIRGHRAESSILHLQSTCKAFGFDTKDGVSFKPDTNITRAELVVLLMKCKFGTLPPVTVSPFKDVSENHWAAPYLSKAKELGWISGYEGQAEMGMFKPENNIVREEAAKIILRAFYTDANIIGLDKTKYTDIDLSKWYAKYATDVERRDIMDGFGNLFGVGRYMTRGEAVITIAKAQ